MDDGLPDFNDPKATKAWFAKTAFESEYGGLDQRITRLADLWKKGLRAESRVLVVCYLDGFGRLHYADEIESSHRSFVRVLEEHSRDRFFSRVFPGRLRDEILGLGQKRKQSVKARYEKLAGDVESALASVAGTLCPTQAVLSLCSGAMAPQESAEVEKHLWRGTTGSAVYDYFRNNAVHKLGARPLSFESARLDGRPGPRVDFPRLYRALRRIAKETKRLLIEQAESGG